MNGPRFWTDLLMAVGPTWGFGCYVAGGAVRDWMLGLDVKDVDIFVSNVNEDNANTLRIPQGWTYIRTIEGEEYGENGNAIRRIYEYSVEDTIVQVMLLEGFFGDHFHMFDNNMVHAKFSLNGGLIFERDFLDGMERQRIYRRNEDAPVARLMDFLEKVGDVYEGWQSEPRDFAPQPQPFPRLEDIFRPADRVFDNPFLPN